MSSPVDIFPPLSALLRASLDDLLSPDAETFLDMVADDVVMEFPYTPPSGIPRLDGKAALAAYLPKVAEMFAIDAMSTPVVHRTARTGDTQVDTVILEFSCTGRGVGTGAPYDQDYISVVTVRDGRIARYRDYWNPLIALRAAGGEDAVAAAMNGGGDA